MLESQRSCSILPFFWKSRVYIPWSWALLDDSIVCMDTGLGTQLANDALFLGSQASEQVVDRLRNAGFV